MQCPVCKKTCNQNKTFCTQCSWEFKMFVGSTPPEEEQRLKDAKRNWQKRLSENKGDSNKFLHSIYSTAKHNLKKMLSSLTSNAKPISRKPVKKKPVKKNLHLKIGLWTTYNIILAGRQDWPLRFSKIS